MTVHVCSPNIRELFIIQFTILRKKCSVAFRFHSLLHLHQGCCLTGAALGGRLNVVFPFFIPRGGSRIFLRKGCTSKEWRHWRWGEKILKTCTYIRRRKLHLRGGAHPLHPPPRSAPGTWRVTRALLNKRDGYVNFGTIRAWNEALGPSLFNTVREHSLIRTLR